MINRKLYYSFIDDDKSKFERRFNMEKFEYKVVTYDPSGFFGGNVKSNQIENQLNMLGDDGWEMVSCTSSNQSYGSTKSLVCIFNRRKDK